MKSFKFCVVALCCFVLGGQFFAQTQTVNADTFRKAGAAYFHAGNFAQAVKAYQEVIRLSPNDADAYSHLGDSYTRLNMNKEAVAAYDKSALLNEQEADRLMTGNAAPVAQPAARPAVAPAVAPPRPVQIVPAQNVPVQAPPAIVAGNNGGHRFSVGQRVEYISEGKWFKAIIVGIASAAETANNGPYYVYLVHSLGYSGSDDWAGDYTDNRMQVRAPGSGPTEPVPGGEANDAVLKAMRGESSVGGPIAIGKYICTMNSNAILVRVGTFTLLAGGSYTDDANNRGTFAYDEKNGQITFRGAGMNGQLAKYDSGRKHFTLQSGNNWVDCEPGR